MGFRHEWEPVDGRPLLIMPESFWSDDTERMTYETAVEGNPRRPQEGPFSYIRRIAAIATSKLAQLPNMPRGQSRRTKDEVLQQLRIQAARLVAGERE